METDEAVEMRDDYGVVVVPHRSQPPFVVHDLSQEISITRGVMFMLGLNLQSPPGPN